MSPLPAADLRDAFGLGEPLATVAKLTFQLHAIGDVADDRAGALCPVRVVEDPRAHLDLDRLTVAADHPRDAASAPGAFALLQDRCPSLIRRVSQALTAERADLSLGPAEDLTRGRVGSQHRPVGHGEQDAVGTVLIQRHGGLEADHPRGLIPFSWVAGRDHAHPSP